MRSRVLLYIISILSLLVPVCSPGEDGDYIGRLFTTPAERAKIDRIRYAVESQPKKVLVPELEEPEAEKQLETTQMPIRLRGMVRGSDGKSIYWINDGNSMQADFLQENITVLPDESDKSRIKIRLPDESVIPLEVGESYIPNNETESSSNSDRSGAEMQER